MTGDATDPGEAFVVRRKIRLRGLSSRERVEAVNRALCALEGMREVRVDSGRQCVLVCYDASRLSFGQIESACPPTPGWWARLRAALYRYMDENAHENAGRKPAPCCSNPGEIYARKHR